MERRVNAGDAGKQRPGRADSVLRTERTSLSRVRHPDYPALRRQQGPLELPGECTRVKAPLMKAPLL